MRMNPLIISTLEPTNVPVAFRVYKGEKTTYIRFFEVVDVSRLHADDELKATQKTMQIDIFSDKNYEDLIEKVKELMKEAGFLWAGGREVPDPESDLYHYVLTYNYNINL